MDKRKLKKAIVHAMAFSRSAWIEKASQRMEGALGEYAKIRYAKMIGSFDFWSDEVTRLMDKVSHLFDDRTKLKQNFNRYKAFNEAIFDSLHSQEQITSARNEFVNVLDSKEEKHAFLKLTTKNNLKSEVLLIEMLQEYLPKDILKKIIDEDTQGMF